MYGINIQGLGKIGWPLVVIVIFIGGLIALGVTFVTHSVSRVLGFALVGLGVYMVATGTNPQWAMLLMAVGGFLAITNLGHEFMLEFYTDGLGITPGGA